MKLDARLIPYSTMLGGGVSLLDQSGRAKFQIRLVGTTEGITKEESEAISRRLAVLINLHGLEVPKR